MHDHGHSREPGQAHRHGHAHDLPSGAVGRAFAIGIGLNLGFVGLEAAYGTLAHSMALVSDATHNLSDVLGLAMAWGATVLARRAPSARRTYGLRRTTLLAALANAVLLLLTVGAVSWEAVSRLRAPPLVAGWTVLTVAAIGVAVNGASALLFVHGQASDRQQDLNVRAAFVHLAADALVSLGVVGSGVLTLATGWRWVDPVTSLAVSALVLATTWSVLRASLDLMLDAVPAHLDPEAVRRWLADWPQVCAVHDLHIWAMSTTEVALTAHLVVSQAGDHSAMVAEMGRELGRRFAIGHPTLQVETAGVGAVCALEPEEVV